VVAVSAAPWEVPVLPLPQLLLLLLSFHALPLCLLALLASVDC